MIFDQLRNALSTYSSSTISGRTSNGDSISVTYEEFLKQSEVLAEKLDDYGIGSDSLIGMYAENCFEWLVWDFAMSLIGGRLMVFPNEMNSELVLESTKTYNLQAIISDTLDLKDAENYLPISELNTINIKIDGSTKSSICPDVLTKVFSSGTSGYLKGINISKTGMTTLIEEFHQAYEVSPDDSHVIFLPLSNFQQRMVFFGCLLKGLDIAISDPNRIFNDCNSHDPTFLIAPPMLYQTIYQMARSSEAPLVIVRKFLGANIRFLVSGMAPISVKILRFFEKIGIPLFNVYGVVETGMISWNTEKDSRLGSVGKPVSDGILKVCEDGTIHVARSNPLSLGYFSCRGGDQESTFLTEGLVDTGDLGNLDNDGYLYIVGRKKDVIVTKGGEKINPSEIEETLCQHDSISDAAIIYDTETGVLIAVIITANESIANNIIRSYNSSAPKKRRILKFVSSQNQFSSEDGTLTRNLKKHRGNIGKLYLSETANV